MLSSLILLCKKIIFIKIIERITQDLSDLGCNVIRPFFVYIESSLITFYLFARAPPRNLNFNFRFLGGFYYENSSY